MRARRLYLAPRTNGEARAGGRGSGRVRVEGLRAMTRRMRRMTWRRKMGMVLGTAWAMWVLDRSVDYFIP